METKKIEIEYKGKKEECEIKKMGYGELCQIISNFTKSVVKKGAEGNIETTVNIMGMRPATISKCLIKAPFPLTNDFIHSELDPVIGDKIYNEIEKYNNISEMQKKKLKEDSNTEPQTSS